MIVDAILWDYDGTLVNSVPKNMAITREILSVVAPRLAGENLPHYLNSEDAYHIANHQSKNWQDLYVNYYGLTEEEMLVAGGLWTEYQLKNTTPVQLFQEIEQVIRNIDLPQGIVSQNSSTNILRVLEKNKLKQKFQSVVGYDDIPDHSQKPHPFGGILCIDRIFEDRRNKTILYIGDHESDILFARNIDQELDESSRVIPILAKYSGADQSNWVHRSDFELESPLALIKILNSQF